MENNVIEQLKNLDGMEDFISIIQKIVNIPDESLTDEGAESLIQSVTQSFNTDREKAIVNALKNFRTQNQTKDEINKIVEDLPQSFNEVLALIKEEVDYSELKGKIIKCVCDSIYDIMSEAANRYTNGDIDIKFELTHKNAKVPSYAHNTDAGADIFAPRGITIKANTYGNIVPCGFKMGLPQGWVAYIYPRSSTGTKTPLRMSNSVGVIDSEYRGEVGMIFDNTSDKDYVIHAGDRVAQMIIAPSYHFTSTIIDDISTVEGDREGGFGSSGK